MVFRSVDGEKWKLEERPKKDSFADVVVKKVGWQVIPAPNLGELVRELPKDYALIKYEKELYAVQDDFGDDITTLYENRNETPEDELALFLLNRSGE